MYCMECGAETAENARFCTKCGASLTREANPAAADTRMVSEPVSVGYQQVQANVSSETQSAAQTYSRGCFGTAWDDLKNTQGAVGKSAFMGLIMLVPILNLVCTGYIFNWARDLVRGTDEPMPQRVVTSENFKTGFYILVVSLVVGIVLGLINVLLAIIPIVGSLAGLALSFVALPFVFLASLRVSLFDRIGAGFEWGAVMDAFKRDYGKAIGATLWPMLICAGIGAVIGIVFSVVLMAVLGVNMGALAHSTQYYSSYGYRGALALMSSGGIALVLLLGIAFEYVACAIAAYFACIMSRGIGHYVVRYVPEWARESFGEGQGSSQASSAQMQGRAPDAPMRNAAQASNATTSDASASAVPASVVAAAPIKPPAPAPSSAPYAYDADLYASGETSVLPEYDEDQETVVQLEPNWKPFDPKHAGEDEMVSSEPQGEAVELSSRAMTSHDSIQEVAHPAEAQGVAPTYPAEPVVRPILECAREPQSAMTSGQRMGDDSDTVVLSGQGAPATAAQSIQAAVQQSLQLTRANGDICVLSSYPTVIGKGSDADLVIDGNSAISRHHVRILRDGNVFAAEDLGSTNKSYIGDYELAPHVPIILSDGDELRIANEVLRVNIV